MSLKTRWTVLIVVFLLPYLVLGAVGFLWLYEHGWSLHWMVAAALLSVITWPLTHLLQRRTEQQQSAAAEANPRWSPLGTAAWKQVEELAEGIDPDRLPLDQPEPLWNLTQQVFETVARAYHPRSRQPLMEVPVPHILRVVELVAHDLRNAFSEHVPGAHILTVRDLSRMQNFAQWMPALYRVYRVASFVINPAAAVARELNSYAQGQVLQVSTQETKRWALQYAIKRAGYYAIELYSGRLVVKDVPFDPYATPDSRRNLSLEEQRDQALDAEPLRILVIGQVKAGKSSLINALFGEVKAAVDVVPRTAQVEPYLLEKEGMQRAIILDTAGYEDPHRAAQALKDARKEFVKSDLILLVCSAKTAARDADHRLLDELRRVFQEEPDREFPPLVVALTQIDQLRPFREWNPPYDVQNPATPKAESIREALDAVAKDLQLPAARVIPVCLAPGQVYNVDEGLIPAILASLSNAQRLRYLRCLRDYRKEEYWSHLRTQAINTGRVLLQAGWEMLEPPPRRD